MQERQVGFLTVTCALTVKETESTVRALNATF